MPHEIDILVGRRIRYARRRMGLTQQDLADKIGVKFQQVQKYETGKNRISASRLHMTAALFGVPVGFFFDEPKNSNPLELDNQTIEMVNTFSKLTQTKKDWLINFMRGI